MYLFLGFLTFILYPLESSGSGCGNRPPLSRVINGVDARPHSWPWQVSVSMGRAHLCGGALIRPNWVVTAAHCVYDYPYPEVYEVIVGAHKLYGVTPVQQRLQVKNLHLHPDFSDKHFKNDIALLELEKPAIMSPKVNTVCLPAAADGKVRDGKWCYITGWGRVFDGSDEAEYLQQAGLIIANDQECSRVNSPLLPVDAKSMLCAGYRNKGGCQGDSGGPLVCEEKGRWLLRGVVSWGKKDCSTEFFTVFARVSSYEKWIDNILGGNGGCGSGGSGGSGGTGGNGGGGGSSGGNGGGGSKPCGVEVSTSLCKQIKKDCHTNEVQKICPKTCGVC